MLTANIPLWSKMAISALWKVWDKDGFYVLKTDIYQNVIL